MKRFLLLFTLISIGAGIIHAQTPNMFNYQAVARNDQGQIIANQSVGIKISIRQGYPNGTVAYAEEHNATTNNNGLVSMMVGNGASLSGSFTDINWGEGPYFIEVAMDETGGTNYTVMGTTQLVSVTTKNKTIANYGYAHATDHHLLVIEIFDLSGNQTNDRFSIIVFGARPPESN